MQNGIEQLSLSSELLKILPVVIGAALAILGGVFTQFLVHRLNGKREREKLVREKAELFVNTIYEYSDWLLEKRETMLFTNDSALLISPLNKAKVQQRIYLPELEESLKKVAKTGHAIERYYINERFRRATDPLWKPRLDPSVYERLDKPYQAAVEDALQQAAELIQRHTGK